MGSAFHMLCLRYSEPQTSIPLTASQLWGTFTLVTFYVVFVAVHQVRQSTDPGQKRNSFSIISQIFSSGEMTEPEMLVNLTDLLLASIDTVKLHLFFAS